MKRKLIMIGILAFLFTATNVSATNFAEDLISKANGKVSNYSDGNINEMYTFIQYKTQQTEDLTEYRYIGPEPSNYVYFNCENDEDVSTCEVWRIIGVFDVEDENGNIEKRAKLIGPNISCNKSFSNLSSYWRTSSLKDYFNNDFNEDSCFNLTESAKSIVKDAKYYLGAGSKDTTTDWTYLTGTGFYNFERGDKVLGTSDSEPYWIGKVGLMYPSDYIYTYSLGYNSTCFSRISKCSNFDISWLNDLSYSQWTLTAVDSLNVFTLRQGLVEPGYVSNSYVVKPVVYLAPDVSVYSGDGSLQQPYQLTDMTVEDENYEKEEPTENTEKEERTENTEKGVGATTFSKELIDKVNSDAGIYAFEHGKTSQTPALTDYRFVFGHNNYVYFNCKDDGNTSTCQRWRIVGVFDVEDEKGNTEKRVKLVSPLISCHKSWNGSNWGNSSLKDYLNNDFNEDSCFNLTYSAKSKIKNAKYYLGGIISVGKKTLDQDSRYGEYLTFSGTGADIYFQERGNYLISENEKPYWIGKVGLIYLSDYVYIHGDNSQCFQNIGGCSTGNWMSFNFDDQWTMTASKHGPFRIKSFGFTDIVDSLYAHRFRAAVYLKPDISAIEGDGSSENPYRLVDSTEEAKPDKPTEDEPENDVSDVLKKTKVLRDRILLAATKEKTVDAAIKKILDKGTPNFNNVSRTKDGLFKTEDDYGDSYYYRGQADNYVLYAGYLWQIIRINGDGSIRLIYAGTQENHTGENTTIKAGPYNSNYDVSYISSDGTDSSIKTIIDDWYEENILDGKDEEGNSLTSYLADANFCNDKSMGTKNYFGTSDRILTSVEPSLKCSQKDDSLTVSNKKLKYPIATITVDEVALAGGKASTPNSSYYLNTNQCYWTMSPNNMSGKYTYMFYIPSDGAISSLISVGSCGGVRPVINLKSDVYVSDGNGSIDDPYQVTLIEPKEEPKEEQNSNIVPSKPDVNNPLTNDSIIIYIMLSVIGLVGFTAGIFKLKKIVK